MTTRIGLVQRLLGSGQTDKSMATQSSLKSCRNFRGANIFLPSPGFNSAHSNHFDN